MRSRNRVGTASKISTRRMPARSTTPENQPISPPTATPMSIAMPVATRPIPRAMREAWIIRDSTSAPFSSVPNQWVRSPGAASGASRPVSPASRW